MTPVVLSSLFVIGWHEASKAGAVRPLPAITMYLVMGLGAIASFSWLLRESFCPDSSNDRAGLS